jgi:Flp pilus assembly protein TadD
MTGDSGPAQALLRASIARNDRYWESHFELGVLLTRQGKLEDAVSEIRRAIECNPNDPAPHYHLARLYDRLGESAEAQAERAMHAKLTAAAQPAGIK